MVKWNIDVKYFRLFKYTSGGGIFVVCKLSHFQLGREKRMVL